MSETKTQIAWEPVAQGKYNKMITKIPMFHREIAKQVVYKKAIELAQKRNSLQVEEGDIVKAFFSEVPMTFYSLMVRLMSEVGFDYEKYET